jgi:hypothetical protein
MHIGIQTVERGLSAHFIIWGDLRKLPQMYLDEVGFGERSAVHYIFSELQ